jgi:tight adherence protein C
MILRSLPQFLDLLLISVEAGMAFTAALERVIKEVDPREPLTREFSQMYHEFLGGLPLSEACERMTKRCQVPDVGIVLSSIVQSDQMGASLGNNLRIQSGDLRDKYRQRLRARAHKIPVKIIFPMLLSFGMIFFLTLGPAFYQLQYLLSKEAGIGPSSMNELKKDVHKKPITDKKILKNPTSG